MPEGSSSRNDLIDGEQSDLSSLNYIVEPMQIRHIPAVSAIERESFPTSWPESAYKREIERNDMACYLVVKRRPEVEPRRERRFPMHTEEGTEEGAGLLKRLGRLIRGEPHSVSAEEAAELEEIVGYTGMWLMVAEAHITTIAVDPAFRGEGIGELLLVALLDRACEIGADSATLECRVSNVVAQRLYRKYTFEEAGLRKRYYSDDGEDALIMTSQPLDSLSFQRTMRAKRSLLTQRLAAH